MSKEQIVRKLLDEIDNGVPAGEVYEHCDGNENAFFLGEIVRQYCFYKNAKWRRFIPRICSWHFGDSGTGKTLWAHTRLPENDTLIVKSLAHYEMERYIGEKHLCVDNFHCDEFIKASEEDFNDLMDAAKPQEITVNGCPAMWQELHINSLHLPEELYPNEAKSFYNFAELVNLFAYLYHYVNIDGRCVVYRYFFREVYEEAARRNISVRELIEEKEKNGHPEHDSFSFSENKE